MFLEGAGKHPSLLCWAYWLIHSLPRYLSACQSPLFCVRGVPYWKILIRTPGHRREGRREEGSEGGGKLGQKDKKVREAE